MPLNTPGSFGLTVSDGLLTASVKSGLPALPALMVNDKLCVLVGPPVTEPLMVIGDVPVGVVAPALMVRVTVAGLPEIGDAALEGWKLHVAPVGKPPQERATAWLNAPAPVT